MSDLLNPLFSVPIIIVLAEMLTMIYLSRKRNKSSFYWIAGGYFFFLALFLAFGLVSRDGFGYGFIPLIVVTNPWVIVLSELMPSLRTIKAWTESIPGMLFGTLLNCVIFYIIGKVSYPKRSAELTGQQTT